MPNRFLAFRSGGLLHGPPYKRNVNRTSLQFAADKQTKNRVNHRKGSVLICRHGDWSLQTSGRLRIGVAIGVYGD